MSGPCVGPCNSRYRRAWREHKAAMAKWQAQAERRKPGEPEPEKPGEPTVVPWEGSPHYCPRDAAQVRRELSELDDLASVVCAFADGHRSSTEAGGRVSGSKSAPSPSPAADAMDELESVLRGWEHALRGTDPPARRGDVASAITTSVSWLLARFDKLIAHPDFGADFGREIGQWHRDLRERGKAGTGRSKMPMPCSRCHYQSLYREDGAKYVECSRKAECGRLMTAPEYEAELEEWQAARRKLAAAS